MILEKTVRQISDGNLFIFGGFKNLQGCLNLYVLESGLVYSVELSLFFKERTGG
jgi:hypothetical protein